MAFCTSKVVQKQQHGTQYAEKKSESGSSRLESQCRTKQKHEMKLLSPGRRRIESDLEAEKLSAFFFAQEMKALKLAQFCQKTSEHQ